MEHNKIEIEFFDRDSRDQFKKLVGSNSGPFLEKLFPWPAVKLHGLDIKPIDAFIWADQTHGSLPNPQPSRIIARSQRGNTLIYTVETANWQLSYKSIRHLALMFPVRRIKLTHYKIENHVCIEAKSANGSYKLNCGHKDCQKYVLPRVYDLNWRRLPHLIYEVHETLNNIVRRHPEKINFTEEEYGCVYHHLIHENTFFAIFENPVIKNARTVFEDQVSNLNNAYLFSMVHLDGYAPAPNIQSKIGLSMHARYIDGLYSQPRNDGYNTNPKRVRR